MKLLEKIGLAPTDRAHRDVGKSWTGKFTGEQHLRAQSALGSLEASVAMGQDDQSATEIARLLLRGVNRMRWAD